MIDLKTLDPATATGSPELVALIAGEWMGWNSSIAFSHETGEGFPAWDAGNGRYINTRHWSPFTDPAHAGEARRKAVGSYLTIIGSLATCTIAVDGRSFSEYASIAAVDNDKGRAEALATMRAILAAMKAREAREE